MKQVHFLGPRGSFTEIATDKFVEIGVFNRSDIELIPCSSILTIINNVDTLNDVIGIVPVENSIEGIVRDTLDNIVKASSNVMITREVIIRISHCLITKASRCDQIKTIVSHSQALAQCQDFINRNFPQGVELQTSTSTSEAVRLIVDKENSWAAIGTRMAANIYQLPVLYESINDQLENRTKFILLDHQIPDRTGNDLTSIVISLRNKPGALVNTLIPFSDNGINLCRIESRPSKKNLGDYLFFIDFDGHIQDQKIKDTIGKIAPNVDYYRFLGSYPKSFKEHV